ncbi:MAGE-domain-containing protein [Desarmillaria tabescens]|uniref:MAGE-domain-containing protein n=1 Tax=Armillaria tabescens TaxID=1929756 RepID=A0AA39T3Z3_ARMTA|nr:MAGE-domain-containing protein [Desarmillaria tabescens]KAK0462896.1 MAGE-domain-containing protein [Desarmillaria tabescens]
MKEEEEGDASMDVDDDEENTPRDDYLASSTRSFNQVLQLAQSTLQKTFGMELVELRSRAELGKDGAGGDEDLEEARKAAGVKKKAAAAGSKSYILRSVLDPAYHRARGSSQREDPGGGSLGGRLTMTMATTNRAHGPTGSLISWSHTDQIGSLGILYIILALILVSGRVLSDAELRAHLKKLRQPMSGSVKFDAHVTHKSVSMEAYMNMIIRQGYVERLAVGDAKKGKGKRVRATQGDDDSGATYEWRWGNRAHSEVGEKAISQFVAEFMVGEQEAEDDEEEGGRDQAQNKVEKMAAGIERAAGGNLSDLK